MYRSFVPAGWMGRLRRGSTRLGLARVLRRSAPLAIAATVATATVAVPASAWAGPRDDMKAAYEKALADYNNLEYEAALETINTAIQAAIDAGFGDDPVLASLYLLRAAITFSGEGNDARDRIIADLKGSVLLNYYVVVPVEMRSDELTALMQEARSEAGISAPQPITLTQPEPACGEALHFEVLLSVPEGGSAVLYWRKAGSGDEFAGEEMPTFSNVAEVDIPADRHGDADIEYFVYAFDASQNGVANLGLQDQPLVLEQGCEGEVVEPEVIPETDDKPKPKSALPRVWIKLGVGTGIGIASGTAEHTYRQFFPQSQPYGAFESACAIARWQAGNGDFASNQELQGVFAEYGPAGQGDALFQAFEMPGARDRCAERHPVTAGIASAPLHVAPEVSVRVAPRISIGLFSRLQVVTASSILRDDPNVDLMTSFDRDVRSTNPRGVEERPPFSWTIGAKFHYFLGKEEWKVRPYVGAFAGYGNARLRVDMGFADDKNGNSVPDNAELFTPRVGDCFPVWPYNNACDPSSEDRNIPQNVIANSDGTRVDVVRIGSGFVGGLVGFNYQIVKNFALFAEVQVGVWFPQQTSLLFDINFGPAITF